MSRLKGARTYKTTQDPLGSAGCRNRSGVDPSGARPEGRSAPIRRFSGGAPFCRDEACFKKALKRKTMEKFGNNLSEELIAAVTAMLGLKMNLYLKSLYRRLLMDKIIG